MARLLIKIDAKYQPVFIRLSELPVRPALESPVPLTGRGLGAARKSVYTPVLRGR